MAVSWPSACPTGSKSVTSTGAGSPWLRPVAFLHTEFTADSRRIVIGCRDGSIVRRSTWPLAEKCARLRTGFRPSLFALHPDGTQIAIVDEARHAGVEIWDLEPGKKVAELPLGEDGPASALTWSPEGRRLAVGLGDTNRAEIWDLAQKRPLVVLEGHAQRVTAIRFHPGGGLVLTLSWDGTGRLWEAETGRQVVYWPSHIRDLHFGRAGTVCGLADLGGRSRLIEVADGREYRTLVPSLGANQRDHFRADISPDGLLAVGTSDGVGIWELATGRELNVLPIGLTKSVQFITRADGRALLSCGTDGLQAGPSGKTPIRTACFRSDLHATSICRWFRRSFRWVRTAVPPSSPVRIPARRSSST